MRLCFVNVEADTTTVVNQLVDSSLLDTILIGLADYAKTGIVPPIPVGR